MRRVLNIAAACGVLLIGSSGARVSSVWAQESLMLGNRVDEWTIGGHSESKTQRVIEYVPPGQKVESWTELLTVQTIKKPRKPPAIDALAASAYEELAKRCPGKVTWNVIARQAASAQGGESLLYEWSVKDCAPEADQHEVARALYGKYNIFRIAYVAKTQSLAPEKREKWIAELSAAQILRQ
jgi:hypothetical protein